MGPAAVVPALPPLAVGVVEVALDHHAVVVGQGGDVEVRVVQGVEPLLQQARTGAAAYFSVAATLGMIALALMWAVMDMPMLIVSLFIIALASFNAAVLWLSRSVAEYLEERSGE